MIAVMGFMGMTTSKGRSLIAACAAVCLVALGACAERGSDAEACAEYRAIDGEMMPIVEQLGGDTALADLDKRVQDSFIQWEFRLAEASVVATDHELSHALRDLADAAGNVTESEAAEQPLSIYRERAAVVDNLCQ